MNWGICNQTFSAMRGEASETGEMVSQILFGETCVLTEKWNDWVQIQCDYDKYVGWIKAKTIRVINDDEYNKLKNAPKVIVPTPIATAARNGHEGVFYILAGSEIYNLSGMAFSQAGEQYTLAEPIVLNHTHNKQKLITDLAMQFQHLPYLWGGKSGFGIDCSGFVQTVFKIAGFTLPRDASKQVLVGDIILNTEKSVAGDLAFFENENGQISHVGIVLAENNIIHSSGNVRIDILNDKGILCRENQSITHNLYNIKRILPGIDVL